MVLKRSADMLCAMLADRIQRLLGRPKPGPATQDGPDARPEWLHLDPLWRDRRKAHPSPPEPERGSDGRPFHYLDLSCVGPIKHERPIAPSAAGPTQAAKYVIRLMPRNGGHGGSGSSSKERRGIGWHWLWFGPLCVVVLWFFETYAVAHALQVTTLFFHRWNWLVLFSLATEFFSAAVMASVQVPPAGLMLIYWRLKGRNLSLGFVIATLVGVVGSLFLTDFVIWTSFPLPVDANGLGHVRMIPFLPWPDGPFGTF